MIILATHKRPDNLKRCIQACKDTEVTERVLVLIDEDDDSYDSISLPENFTVHRIPPGSCASRRANIPFELHPDEPYYAIMGDDVVPKTKGWDKILRARAGGWKVAYCADGIHNQKLATHPFIGGELARAQGFVEEPSMLNWYADNCRMDVGAELGLLDYVEEVQFEHLHHCNGKAPVDETYTKQGDHKADLWAYQRWRLFGGFAETVQRISEVINQQGRKCDERR